MLVYQKDAATPRVLGIALLVGAILRYHTQMTREELDALLTQATEAIGEGYFLLPIAGGESIARERVYCYELYHQMRRRWRREWEYVLNGEIDKAGHPKLRPLGVGGIPDFLIHRPGNNDGNHTIIEVKSVGAGAKDIENDLAKFSAFVTKANYQRAIYLLYGTDAAATITKIEQCAANMPSLPSVDLFWHQTVGKPALLVRTIRPVM